MDVSEHYIVEDLIFLLKNEPNRHNFRMKLAVVYDHAFGKEK